MKPVPGMVRSSNRSWDNYLLNTRKMMHSLLMSSRHRVRHS
jgi:hypothetical protein